MAAEFAYSLNNGRIAEIGGSKDFSAAFDA
jgi:hypothetical protein